MANLKSNIFVNRSESMKLPCTRGTSPGLPSTRWSSDSRAPHPQSSKPTGEATAGRSSIHPRTSSSGGASTNASPRAAVACVSNRADRVPDTTSQLRHVSKHPQSPHALRRPTNGGRPVQRRMSLDTTMSAATNRKPILKNRRSSISNGELPASGSPSSSASSSSPSNRPKSSLSAVSARAGASAPAYSQTFTDGGGCLQGGGYTNSDMAAVLKDCSYRLALVPTVPPPESCVKKVSFDDQISVISK